jgi:hydrogenase/urease accessory protein HupE
VEYDFDGVTGSAVLTVGDPRFDVTSEAGTDAMLVPAEERGVGRLWDFGVLGAEHMLLGPDHLLFLLALLIGARGRRDVVVTASAFTAAHSVTFGLASLGAVPVLSAFVEPVIAASIVVVALLGLRDRREEASAPWRVPAALGFGLLHGLGFAGALGIEDPASWQLLWALLAFNVGLEVAQLAVILLVVPLLRQLRRATVGPRLITVAGLGVAAIGAFWLLERLPLAARLMASG